MAYSKQILTGIFLFFAGIATAQEQPKKTIADKIIAIVGDRIILYSDIMNLIKDAERHETSLPLNSQCTILEQALLSKMLMLQAEKDSLPVIDEEIEAQLDQQIRYFIRKFGSREELERIANKTIYQIKDDARESVKERKLAEEMHEKIIGNIRITPAEVNAFFDRIPADSLPFFESELEVGQIVLYPKASRDLEQYTINELNNYKRRIENKTATFCQLAITTDDADSRDRCGQYEINRNEKTWDPGFLSTVFRLKDGEISAPVKTKSGYFLIQMVERKGDDANVRLILREPPVTDAEISQALNKLDTIRSKIIAGTISFNQAASKYSDIVNFSGPFIVNSDGFSRIIIDQLDKDMVAAISKMKIGDFSQPVAFTSEQGKKGARIIYLKSRSEPHRMNLQDDYSKISQMALEEKKGLALDKWLKARIPTYYIMVDNITAADCPQVQKYASTEAKGF